MFFPSVDRDEVHVYGLGGRGGGGGGVKLWDT